MPEGEQGGSRQSCVPLAVLVRYSQRRTLPMPSVDWSIVDVAGLRSEAHRNGKYQQHLLRGARFCLNRRAADSRVLPTALTGEAADFSSCRVNLFDQPRRAGGDLAFSC